MSSVTGEQNEIYLMGICGVGMGNLAGLLSARGFKVRGSDANVYPPMSDRLRSWGIELLEGYDAQHLSQHQGTVVVGNVIRRDNPEATYAREAGLRTLSFPQAIAEYGIEDRHSIVIAGTHGKTTTTALTAHLLRHAKLRPSYLIGGSMVGDEASFCGDVGQHFVVEGDEYDTAYFDKGPKFLHYRGKTVVVTSLEFDHADIFSCMADVEQSFRLLIEQIPADGSLILWHEAKRARSLVEQFGTTQQIVTYSTAPHTEADWQLEAFEIRADGMHMIPTFRGQSLGPMHVPLWGEYNAQNVLAALAAVYPCGLSSDQLRAGLAAFQGVQRRMQVLGQANHVTVVDDFAHHPTAVRAVLKAARQRWPNAKIWAVFEPRSHTSRRNIFVDAYIEAFKHADHTIIGSHPRLSEIPLHERFIPADLARIICSQGGHATAIAEVPEIIAYLCQHVRSGDVVLSLSNGDFSGFAKRLLQALQPVSLRPEL